MMPEAWGYWGIITIKDKPSQKQVSTVPQNCTDTHSKLTDL